MLTDGRTDGRKVITIAHPEQSSGELKTNLVEYFKKRQIEINKLYTINFKVTL